MEINEIMHELALLSTAQTKKTYLNHGAREPLFGVSSKAMKPLSKKIKKNYRLSLSLFDTGNYDAIYLAGMIADTLVMKIEDFEKWMQSAYCSMISDYVVAVTLSETLFAQALSDKWINSDQDLYKSAGWSCYAWMLGHLSDDHFNKTSLQALLQKVEASIQCEKNNTKYAMNNFIISIGISYLPLHNEAIDLAKKVGAVKVDMGNTNCKTPLASDYIQRAIDKGKIGFKRKKVRC